MSADRSAALCLDWLGCVYSDSHTFAYSIRGVLKVVPHRHLGPAPPVPPTSAGRLQCRENAERHETAVRFCKLRAPYVPVHLSPIAAHWFVWRLSVGLSTPDRIAGRAGDRAGPEPGGSWVVWSARPTPAPSCDGWPPPAVTGSGRCIIGPPGPAARATTPERRPVTLHRSPTAEP